MEDLLTKRKTEIATPKLFNVILLNDDYTPMDFVMMVLAQVFRKTFDEAGALTLGAHKNGKALVGTYSRDMAETLTKKAEDMAKEYEFPFKMGIEPA